MKKHKILYMTLLTLLMIGALVSCQKKEEVTESVSKEETKAVVEEKEKEDLEETVSYEDGIYFASEDKFSSNGWKYVVTLTIEDGKISKADWNGVNVNAGPSKKAIDKAGKYNMKAFGGAQSEWSEQAKEAEEYLKKFEDSSTPHEGYGAGSGYIRVNYYIEEIDE